MYIPHFSQDEIERVISKLTPSKSRASCIYRSFCPLCTDFLPTLAATAHGAAHELNNMIYLT